MKHNAFTMLELIFVIVVAGIIIALAMPRMDDSNLRQAADQVVRHIQYTQHLAMMDDKFDDGESNWFNRRWTLRFQPNVVFGGKPFNNAWTYTIFSDLPNFAGHHPDLNGMARNPLDTNKFLSGGYDNTLSPEDSRAMKELQLNKNFGIQNITFSGGCRANVQYLHFDYLGRPMNSFPNNAPYETVTPGWHKLLTARCIITLTDASGNNVQIGVEPETGYAHIL